MNLRSVDLNLLVILDVLLDEAHVSRAAERLGLSQPAGSTALDRCRQLFDDPLLQRQGASMVLTPKAESLRRPLKTALGDIAALLVPPTRDTEELKGRVRIVMFDLPTTVIVGELVRRLAHTAPGIDLIAQPWPGEMAAIQDIEKGHIELAASVFPTAKQGIRRERVFDEHYVIVMRRDHPAVEGFSLDRWLSFPHVAISGRGRKHDALDEALHRQGLERRVGVVVPSFLSVPTVLAATDLIAALPSRCVPSDGANRFAVFLPPIVINNFPIDLVWRQCLEDEPCHKHVRAVLRDILSTLLFAEPLGEGKWRWSNAKKHSACFEIDRQVSA